MAKKKRSSNETRKIKNKHKGCKKSSNISKSRPNRPKAMAKPVTTNLRKSLNIQQRVETCDENFDAVKKIVIANTPQQSQGNGKVNIANSKTISECELDDASRLFNAL